MKRHSRSEPFLSASAKAWSVASPTLLLWRVEGGKWVCSEGEMGGGTRSGEYALQGRGVVVAAVMVKGGGRVCGGSGGGISNLQRNGLDRVVSH